MTRSIELRRQHYPEPWGRPIQGELAALRSVAICRDWHHLGRARTLDEVGRLIDEVNSRTINDYFAEQPPAKYTVVTLGSRKLEMPQGVP